MKQLTTLFLSFSALLAAPTAGAQAVRKPATRPTSGTAAKPAAKPIAPATKAAPTTAQQPDVTRPAAQPAAATTANDPFAVGTSVLNLGVGLGSRYSYGLGYFGGNSSVSPAISLSYERGILALGPGYLGVGVIVGYQGASYDFGGGDKWHYSDVVLMARGAFHYPVAAQFDAYGGVGLGLRYLHSSYSGSLSNYGSDGSAYLTSGLFVGGRYFFTPRIGAFAELGYDQSYLKIGLSAKF